MKLAKSFVRIKIHPPPFERWNLKMKFERFPRGVCAQDHLFKSLLAGNLEPRNFNLVNNSRQNTRLLWVFCAFSSMFLLENFSWKCKLLFVEPIATPCINVTNKKNIVINCKIFKYLKNIDDSKWESKNNKNL